MLAKSGPIPTRGGYAHEVKWDGFRTLVSTRPFRIRSRRGWDMTQCSKHSRTSGRGVYDAELVAIAGAPPYTMRAILKRPLESDSAQDV